ncbi:MAG: aminotransferase class III-fold pyridoxal phosphate-dependent enzyme [Pseudomonadota bacterium]
MTFPRSSHGSTYGGNPLATAVGAAVLEEVTSDGFLDNVGRLAGRLKQKLAGLVDAHPDILEAARGEGLMMGLKCKVPNMDLVNAGYEQEILTVPAGDNVVRVLPPLNVTEAEIDEAVRRLDAACAALEPALEQA